MSPGSIHDRNLAGAGVDVALVRHFETSKEHLREELWRIDAYLRHSALLETRIERTLTRGAARAPRIDLVRAFNLDARQRATLTLALAVEIDTNLPVALRYLANDPARRHVDGRLLSMLVYDSVRSRARLARDLSPRSPLVFYRLLTMEILIDTIERMYRERGKLSAVGPARAGAGPGS